MTKKMYPLAKGDIMAIFKVVKKYYPEFAIPMIKAMADYDPSVMLNRKIREYVAALTKKMGIS